MNEVTRIAQSVADNIYTVGVSLDRCSVPHRGKQESLPFGSLENGMGMRISFASSLSLLLFESVTTVLLALIGSLMDRSGIHNELGVQRDEIQSLQEVVSIVLSFLLLSISDTDTRGSHDQQSRRSKRS